MIDAANSTLRRIPGWTIYVVGFAWAAWLFWQALNGLGAYAVEPINVLERAYGEVALILLVVGLAITPLRQHLGLNLIKFRRAIGVTAFFYVLAHFLVFAVLDVQSLERVWTEVVKRPYVTVGMLSFVLLIPLAVTSNNMSLRKMGAASWKSLHKLTYPAVLLGALHYLWLVRGFPTEPLFYFIVIFALLLLRTKFKKRQKAAA